MKNMLRTLALAGAFLGFGLLAGCTEYERVTVEVVKISGTLPQLMSSSGALFGNESTRIGAPTLIITVKANNGHIWTLDMLDGKTTTKAALLTRICVGSKVSITVAHTEQTSEQLAVDPAHYGARVLADDMIAPEPCTK